MADFKHVPILDVLTDNCREMWPAILLAVRSSTFVAIDMVSQLLAIFLRIKERNTRVEVTFQNVNIPRDKQLALNCCCHLLSGIKWLGRQKKIKCQVSSNRYFFIGGIGQFHWYSLRLIHLLYQ